VIFVGRNHGNFMPRQVHKVAAFICEKPRFGTRLDPYAAMFGVADSPALSPYLAMPLAAPLVTENSAAGDDRTVTETVTEQ
jgi:hypothetical protein